MPIPPADTPAARSAANVVLDTNVVLDWLVFRDPSCLALDAALRAGRLDWVATGAMREELEQVLTREHIATRLIDPSAPLAAWAALARVEPSPPASALRCHDPDDQKFIDLALHLGNTVLLSRDRAVLALARQARLHGVEILTAADWSRRQTGVSG